MGFQGGKKGNLWKNHVLEYFIKLNANDFFNLTKKMKL